MPAEAAPWMAFPRRDYVQPEPHRLRGAVFLPARRPHREGAVKKWRPAHFAPADFRVFTT